MSAFWWTLRLIHDQYFFVFSIWMALSIMVGIAMVVIPLTSVRIAGFLFILLFLATVYLGATGFRDVYTYIFSHGVAGEYVASKIEGTGNRFNDVEIMQYTGYLKLAEGQLIEANLVAGHVPSYPVSKEPLMLVPQSVYPVKYLANYPRWFVIERGTQKSIEKEELCRKLRADLLELEAKLLLSPSDALLIQERVRLTEKLQSLCH